MERERETDRAWCGFSRFSIGEGEACRAGASRPQGERATWKVRLLEARGTRWPSAEDTGLRLSNRESVDLAWTLKPDQEHPGPCLLGKGLGSPVGQRGQQCLESPSEPGVQVEAWWGVETALWAACALCKRRWWLRAQLDLHVLSAFLEYTATEEEASEGGAGPPGWRFHVVSRAKASFAASL